jgi:hypothetical protein
MEIGGRAASDRALKGNPAFANIGRMWGTERIGAHETEHALIIEMQSLGQRRGFLILI